MDKEKFINLVAQAVADLPDDFQERLENVDVVVEDLPSPSQMRSARIGRGYTLLGLYEGVPLTERGSHYGLVPPDKITIFQKTIEASFKNATDADIRSEIQKVVRHEIAHHFGIGDARLKEIEDNQK